MTIEQGKIKIEAPAFDPEAQVTSQDWEDMGKATEGCWTDPKAPSQIEMAYDISILSPDKAQEIVGTPPEGEIKPWANKHEETTIPDLFRDRAHYNIHGDPAVDMHREVIYKKFFPAERENIQKKEGETKLTIQRVIKDNARYHQARLREAAERARPTEGSEKSQFEDDAKLMSIVADARILYPGRTAQELGLDEKTLKDMEDRVAQHKELWKRDRYKSNLAPEFAKYLADMKVIAPEEYQKMDPMKQEDWELMNKGLEAQKDSLAHGNSDISVRFTMQAAAMKILAAKEARITENGLELTMPGQEAQVNEGGKIESAPVAEAKEKEMPSSSEREANLKKTLAEFSKKNLADPAIAAEIERVRKDIEAQKQQELKTAAGEAEKNRNAQEAQAAEKKRQEELANTRAELLDKFKNI